MWCQVHELLGSSAVPSRHFKSGDIEGISGSHPGITDTVTMGKTASFRAPMRVGPFVFHFIMAAWTVSLRISIE